MDDAHASISVGFGYACGLTEPGQAHCWGANGKGELGNGTDFAADGADLCGGGLRFTLISADHTRTCGLVVSGSAYCWGSNTSGALGDAQPTPTSVAGFLTFRSISTGSRHTCGLTRAGEAHCWGSNSWGELGDGTMDKRPQPGRGTGGLTFTALAAGGHHTCAVAATGASYCWGRDLSTQLGASPATAQILEPAQGGFPGHAIGFVRDPVMHPRQPVAGSPLSGSAPEAGRHRRRPGWRRPPRGCAGARRP